ncbi:PIN domain-containing protein [Arcticibacter tournemirensis]|uniref:PIN domain-containing protein n=1 Tax=Arcticibacter tournemirensis TaxID=699437 RepID=A0A4Q0MBS4_9SPHI|nr:PIN domain-containing protein [Arcticibacter tournemirensis]RXF70523.1 hypothetical protein EKH83_07725 [Arcticibacter tournemirensis]
MNYFFLDTNIFLHFKPIENIQWEGYVPGEYRIAIAPVVMEELDKKKFDNKAKIKDRAKKVLGMFQDALFVDNHPLLCFCTEDAVPEDYNKFLLSQIVQDDRLLITILKFISTHQNDNCYLVTYDTGPMFKAKRLGIKFLLLRNQELLPIEVDDQERENRELKLEIQRLKNLQPKLSLRFENGNLFMSFQLEERNNEGSANSKRANKMAAIETDPFKNPIMQSPEMVRQYYGSLYVLESYNKAIHRYNKALDEYEKSFRHLRDWEVRSLYFKAYISNEGGKPAEGLEISLKFPEEIAVCLPQDRPSYPRLPKKPRKDDFTITGIISGMVQNQEFESNFDLVQSPSILENCIVDNEGTWIIKLKELKHKKSKEIGPLWLTFPDREMMQSFKVAFEIHANNLPVPINGDLNFIIQGY